MRRGIIVSALVLVNALAFDDARAASVEKAKVVTLIDWLQRTGKDRADFDQDNAVLVGRTPGNGKSKARGAPGNEGEADRLLHLFTKKDGKPDFIVIEQVKRDDKIVADTLFRINSKGKLEKLARMTFDLDANGMEDIASAKVENLKLNKDSRQMLDADLDFWLARAKQDSKPEEAKPNGEAKP